MEQSTELGSNKTGIDMSPIHSKEMIAASERILADEHDGVSAVMLKQSFLTEAEPLGSVPLPGTVKGIVKSAMKMASGHHPEVFINKLGERLAYERTGVRIYEQLIIKCEHARATNTNEIAISIDLLEQFCEEEAEHFDMLVTCIKKLGADPTAQTPDADASAVGAAGLLKVIVDPRTSISQSLQAMLAVELLDNDAWELLIKLAEDMGLPHMAKQFQHALNQEDVHLAQIRQWYEESIRVQAKIRMPLS